MASIRGAELLTIVRFVPAGPGTFHDARFEKFSLAIEESKESDELTAILRLKGPYYDRCFELHYGKVDFCSFSSPQPADDLLMHELRMENGMVIHEIHFDHGRTIKVSCRDLRFHELLYELTYEDFPQQIRASVRGFDRIYDEHATANDGVLPHVLLGDLVRFLCKEAELHGTRSTSLGNALILLERGMGSQDLRLQELVAVSFLENLDPGNPCFPVIRSLFGPKLEEQFRRCGDDSHPSV